MSSEQNQILLESLNSSEMSRFSSGSFVRDPNEEIIVIDPQGNLKTYSGSDLGKIKVFSFAERIKRLFNPNNGYSIYILKTDGIIFPTENILNFPSFDLFLSLEIRVAIKEIRVASRNTQGVRIIKLSGDEKVVSAIRIDDNLI